MTINRRPVLRSTAVLTGVVVSATVLAACSPGGGSDASSSATSSAASDPASASAAASPSPAASGGAKQQSGIDLTTLPATIPFAYTANHVIVDAGFGTGDTFPMLLDTGAPLNVSADLVAQFGWPAVGQQEAAAAGGTITSDVVGVNTVTVGDVTASNVAGITPWVDDANPLSCLTQNGLVGSNVMAGAVWQIDYQAETVTVAASTEGMDHIDGAIAVPFEEVGGPGGSTGVLLGIGNTQLPFLVDTGSDAGILAGPNDLKGAGVTVPADAPTVESLAAGAAGPVDLKIPFVTTSVDLGGTKVDYPIGAAEVIQGPLGNIGNGFLSNFVVTFDWPTKTMYLDPIASDGSVAAPQAGGASISWDGKQAIVGTLAKGGPAQKAGLKLGDVVTAVNGAPVTTRDEFCAVYTSDATDQTITTDAGDFDAGVIPGFLGK